MKKNEKVPDLTDCAKEVLELNERLAQLKDIIEKMKCCGNCESAYSGKADCPTCINKCNWTLIK